jgi:hypothetical protein
VRVGLAGGGVCGDPRTFSDPVQDTEESRESARGRYVYVPGGGAAGGPRRRARRGTLAESPVVSALSRRGPPGRGRDREAGDGPGSPEAERGARGGASEGDSKCYVLTPIRRVCPYCDRHWPPHAWSH